MSSPQYSKLPSEEFALEDHIPMRRSSVVLIPEGRMKRVLLFLTFLGGSACIFIYQLPSYMHHDVATRISFHPLEESNTTSISTLIHEIPTPSWSWSCQDGRCIRNYVPDNTTITNKQSWKTCNMICIDMPIWPEPMDFDKQSNEIIALDTAKFTIKTNSPKEVSPYLRRSFKLMQKDFERIKGTFKSSKLENIKAKGLTVNVKVNSSDLLLRLTTDESYELTIRPTDANSVVVNITAETYCGARNGLETLSQLIWYDEFKRSAVTFAQVSIMDYPKFKYRGILLDTARNYFPVVDILRTLDAMAASKLNTFHWHVTDSQSFPLKFDSVPYFAWYGAYSRKEVYTSGDIRTIVTHARLRGIRVVIEVDGPAHVGEAWSWGKKAGIGDLAYCIGAEPWYNFCGEPPCGQLNPHNEQVYALLEKIYSEILNLTGVNDVFHLGGDEINLRCWSKETNVTKTWLEYIENTKNALQKANNGTLPELVMLWSSKFTDNPLLKYLKDYTIQLWGASKWPITSHINKSRLKTVISHVSHWYLDCGFGKWRSDDRGLCTYVNEKTIYSHAPWRDDELMNAVGGEACLWSELVSRGNLDSKLWPRGAALAERLWSDPPHGMTVETILRLDMQRRRLVERGIRANAIGPRWCMDDPYACYKDDGRTTESRDGEGDYYLNR